MCLMPASAVSVWWWSLKLRDHLYRAFGVAASHDGVMEIAKEETVFAKRDLVRKSLPGEGWEPGPPIAIS